MEKFQPTRIENFNQNSPVHFDSDNSPFYNQLPLFYLVIMTGDLPDTHEVYFVNLQDKAQNYLAVGNTQNPHIVYYDIAPNEAVKLFEYHRLHDLSTPIVDTLWLSTKPYYVYKIDIFEQNDKIPTQTLSWQKPPITAYPLIVRKIEHPKNLPLSPKVIEYRRNWHNELIKIYDKPLADFIVAVNDMMYRYDFLPLHFYAYGLDLYDEWTSEAIKVACILAKSYQTLDYVKVERIIKEVFVHWLEGMAHKQLKLSEDAVNEVIEAFNRYKKQTKICK